MVLGAIVSFVVALLVGGLGIYISGRLVAGVDDYSHAVVTALLGALAWAIGSLIPVIGSLVALVAWVWVINWRYPGGWVKAAIMGLAASSDSAQSSAAAGAVRGSGSESAVAGAGSHSSSS